MKSVNGNFAFCASLVTRHYPLATVFETPDLGLRTVFLVTRHLSLLSPAHREIGDPKEDGSAPASAIEKRCFFC